MVVGFVVREEFERKSLYIVNLHYLVTGRLWSFKKNFMEGDMEVSMEGNKRTPSD